METLLLKNYDPRIVTANHYFSREIRLILIIFFFSLTNVSLAASISSTASGGSWTDVTTWVGGVVPTMADDITIVAGATVVIRSPYDFVTPATCNSLIINGTLIMGNTAGATNRALNIATFMLINSGGTLTNDGVALHQINIGGNFTNNGTFNALVNTPGIGRIIMNFNGIGAQQIDGTSPTQNFQDFFINKPAGQTLSTTVNITTINITTFTQTSGDFLAPSTLSVSGDMTLTAGTYTAGSTTTLGGNFSRAGLTATFIAGTGTVTFNGTSQAIGGSTSPISFYNVTTSGSTNLTFDYHLNIGGNLTIGNGTTLILGGYNLNVIGTTTVGGGVSGNLIFSSTSGSKYFEGPVIVAAGGTWDNPINESAHFYSGITNNGIFKTGLDPVGTSAKYLFEVNSQSINGILTMPDVFVDGGLTLTNNGVLTVSDSLGGGGTLLQAANSTLNIGGTSAIAILNATNSGNTVNYTGGVQTIKGTDYQNLGLSGSGAKSLNTSTDNIFENLTLSGTVTTIAIDDLTIGGSLSIGINCSLTNGNGVNVKTLSIGNSLTGEGTLVQSSNSILNINGASPLASINAAAIPNTVNYNAASPLIIPGSYHNLFLNQSSGNASLNGNILVAGTLTLNTGNLILEANNLTLGASAALSILSPSASRMIIASGAGELRRTYSSTGSFVFPIGDNTSTLEYSPVTVNVTSASGFSSAYVGVSVVDAKHLSNASTTHFLSRYWNVTQSGILTCVVNISGTYSGADINGTEGSIKAAQLNGAFNQASNPWIKYASLASNSMSLTGATLTAGQTSVFTGITGADPIVTIGGDVAICSGSSFPLVSSVTGDPTILYSWSPATGLSAANVANPTATPTITTDYTLTIIDGNGGSSVSTPKKVTVNSLPLAPVVATPVIYCLNATSTALIATGTSLLWYTTSTGGTGSTTAPIPITSAAGNTSYWLSQTNANNCESPRAEIVVTVNALPSIPTVSATAQPTCSVATGEIMVSSSLTGLSFSIDGLDYTNTTGLFTGLAAGDYTVTAKNGAGCISAASTTITINAQPAIPAMPTASTTAQPTCSVATGEIMVSTNLTGLSFSIDGLDYTNTTGLFTGLAAGDYTVTAKNGAGCISAASSTLTINAQPAIPAMPTASATAQPTCAVATGEISVSSSLTGLSFSVDGSDYTNTTGVFTGLAAGNYTVTAKNGAGCVSSVSTTLTINPQPTIPSVSTPSIALCVGASMTASPSIDGFWISSATSIATINSTTGVITGISAGTVTFTFTSTTTGCSNATNTVTVSPLPGKPTITTSNLLTETPTLTSSSDTGNQWFKDNVAITGATSKTLTVSANGSYTVQVTTNGCISALSDAVAIVITGIEQRIISDRSMIYPNPAKDVIQLEWSDFAMEAGIEIKIYDQVGRLIIAKVMSSSDNSLDVRSLLQGPYVFMARQNKILVIQKFIKE